MLKQTIGSVLALTLAVWLPASASAEPEAEWRFRVTLDEKEIGFHDFFLDEEEDLSRLTSNATFEYKLLFVKLFEYQHRNEETWKGNCLTSIDSTTDSNGEPFQVRGRADENSFNVQATGGMAELPPCVMSFAYWNPEFLRQEQLLNTQNGEFMQVRVDPPEADLLSFRGQTHSASRYRLRAGELDLLLWYSDHDGDWLALESKAQGGRKLRYERL